MVIQKNTKKKLKKVSKALKKASNLHAKQAKTLDAIKMKKGGAPDNVKTFAAAGGSVIKNQNSGLFGRR